MFYPQFFLDFKCKLQKNWRKISAEKNPKKKCASRPRKKIGEQFLYFFINSYKSLQRVNYTKTEKISKKTVACIFVNFRNFRKSGKFWTKNRDSLPTKFHWFYAQIRKNLTENFHRKKVEKNLRESSSVNVRPIIFIIFYNHEHVGTERKI